MSILSDSDASIAKYSEVMGEVLAAIPPVPDRPRRIGLELRHAVLCIECDLIYTAHGDGCPSCGSRARFTLTRVIRPIREE